MSNSLRKFADFRPQFSPVFTKDFERDECKSGKKGGLSLRLSGAKQGPRFTVDPRIKIIELLRGQPLSACSSE